MVDCLHNFTPSDLRHLGIRQTHDDLGNATYELDILQHDASTRVRAIFDPSRRQWRCVASVSHDFAAAAATVTVAADTHNIVGTSSNVHRRRSAEASFAATTIAPSWTDHLPDTEHVRFLLATDWASTPLGPMRDWHEDLRIMLYKMLTDPRGASLYWGPDRIAIYNQHCATLLAGAHPRAMGLPYRLMEPVSWLSIKTLMEHCDRTKTAVRIPAIELNVTRNGYLEETYFDGTFAPLFSPSQERVVGIYNVAIEITRQIISDRRSKALHHLADTSSDNNQKPVWKHILEALQMLDRDVPLAILYGAEESVQTKICNLKLEGTLGIAAGHPAAPQSFDLNQDSSCDFAPTMRLAKSSGAPVVYKSQGEALPEALTHDVEWRGYGEASGTIVVIPLFCTGRIVGIIVLGTNPRRAYCDDYKHFVQEFARLAAAAINNSLDSEEAAARQMKLKEELTEMERFIRHIADISPSGLYSVSRQGTIVWANAKFYEVTGLSDKDEDKYSMSFMNCVLAEDVQEALDLWQNAIATSGVISTEIRVKRRWQPPPDADAKVVPEEPAWILSNAIPTYDNSIAGNFIGCVVDISALKWAQRVQADAAEKARDAKRLQEQFIDVTSHEMRNPLSAIMQCADGIVASVRDGELLVRQDPAPAIESIIEAAQTIMLCAFHQKRIVDDILTVSKLDSSMLSISPTLIRPEQVISEALQMFESEFSAFGITRQLVVEPSFHNLEAELVYCDPMRLSQICVNLLTNAIKFTKYAQVRRIQINIGAASSPPQSGVSSGLIWFPTYHAGDAPTVDADDDASNVYLTFTIADSGSGITEDEITKLFNRFVQANAKTHAHYGGSGLGLFISRQLTELMGGMIGAISEPGKGSTFAFYVRAARPTSLEMVGHKVPSLPSNSRRLSLADNAMTAYLPASTESATEILLVEGRLIHRFYSSCVIPVLTTHL